MSYQDEKSLNQQYLETSYQIFQQNLEEKCFEHCELVISDLENKGFTKEAWELQDELKAVRANHIDL